MRGKDTADIVRRGVAHVPQGRGTFPELSVLDNLHLGAYVRRDRKGIEEDITRWFDVFPRLGERKSQAAGSLSGGEQQMLAVARAMMSRPKVLLLDEPSLGLAPLIIEDLFRPLQRDQPGDQHDDADRRAEREPGAGHRVAAATCWSRADIVLEGRPTNCARTKRVREAYLGA